MKAIIYLSGPSAYALAVLYHTGFSGVAHQFVRVPKHNAHIYQGRELELAEFNKIAEEIFGAKEDVYYKPCARLIAEPGDGQDDTRRAEEALAKLAEREATIADLQARLAEAERQVNSLLQSKAVDRPPFVPECSPTPAPLAPGESVPTETQPAAEDPAPAKKIKARR